jgi:hypothetical protein
MTANEILAQQTTKTRKIQQLLGLGMSRQEVATLVGVGYGFVQNVYAKLYPERIRARRQILDGPVAATFAFTRSFGVEIEMFNVGRERLVSELRAAGIAIEAEGYNHTTRAHWKIVDDGSVRGSDALELVSPVLRGADGLEQLRKVCATLKRLNAKINRTCGLHIHFGTDDFRDDSRVWKNLFHNYATLEPLIDGFMPASRRANNNTYCRSLRVHGLAGKLDRATTLQELERAVTGASRYFKVNVQAYWRHRTVEFRQHSGSIEFEKISNWLHFLARMIEFSKTQRVAGARFEDAAQFATPELIGFYRQRTQRLAMAA